MMGGGPGMGCGGMGARSAATVDARLAAFKAEAEDHPEQEAACRPMPPRRRSRPSGSRPCVPAARHEHERCGPPGLRSQMMKQRAAELDELAGTRAHAGNHIHSRATRGVRPLPSPMGGRGMRGGGMRGGPMAW